MTSLACTFLITAIASALLTLLVKGIAVRRRIIPCMVQPLHGTISVMLYPLSPLQGIMPDFMTAVISIL